MKKFISMFAALVLSAVMVSAATAATWKPFLHGVTSPADLANKIQASLVKDRTGKSMIDPERCKRDGSCATPLNYLEALQKVNSGAHLKNVNEIHDFLRTLQVIDAPVGKYWISCLKPDGAGYKAEIHCLERSFKKGEKAWIDPKTNVIVFASDCTNVVEKPVSPKQVCAEIYFFARTGDTVVRHTPMGSPAFEDDCFAIKKVGETEFRSPWRDDCASVHCTFAANEAHLNKKAWKLASYELVPGEYVVRVPVSFAKSSEYVMAFCIERTKMPWPEFPPTGYTLEQRNEYAKQRDEWIAGHSDVVYVWQNAYRVGNDGVPRARIYYTESEVSATETVKMYWRWGVWFREHPEQLVR